MFHKSPSNLQHKKNTIEIENVAGNNLKNGSDLPSKLRNEIQLCFKDCGTSGFFYLID